MEIFLRTIKVSNILPPLKTFGLRSADSGLTLHHQFLANATKCFCPVMKQFAESNKKCFQEVFVTIIL